MNIDVKSAVKSGKHVDAGSVSTFYHCGCYGIKTYDDLNLAFECYQKQKRLAFLGLAPKVFSNLQKINSNTYPYYGYATELAITVMDEVRVTGQDYDGYYGFFTLIPEYGVLKDKLIDAGYVDNDGHDENYGRLACGKCVVIDMDIEEPERVSSMGED